jgi:hypothetical protein
VRERSRIHPEALRGDHGPVLRSARVRIGLVILLAVVVVGCGGSHQLRVSRDGRAVLADALDGHLDTGWSCGSRRAALTRLPSSPPMYSPIPGIIGQAAGQACDAALRSVRVGVTDSTVRRAFGNPDNRARCWTFKWPPTDLSQRDRGPSSRGSSIEGARFCFQGGRVTKLQTAVHA